MNEDATRDAMIARFGQHGLSAIYQHHDYLELQFEYSNGYGASVSKGQMTYGGPQGYWELAVLRHGGITYKTPITRDVIGWLSDEELIEKLHEIEKLGRKPR